MNLECEKEKLCVNKFIKNIEKEVILEEDIIIPDSKPDILSPVTINSNVCVCKKEITNDNIKLEGTSDICISYIPDSNVDILRCINSEINFKKNIDDKDIKENMDISYNIYVKEKECKILNGRKVRVKLVIILKLSIYEKVLIEILKDIRNIKNIQSLVNNINLNTIIGKGTSKNIVKDNIKLIDNDEILEIIKVNYNIKNKDYKISYNKVLAKADLEVKVLYITQDNKIKSVSGSIPIMEFVNIENVDENNMIALDFKIQNFNLKNNSNEEHSLYIESEVEANVIAFENKNIDIIKDIYIPNENISYIENNIKIITSNERINKNVDLKQSFKVDDFSESDIKDVKVIYKNNENRIFDNELKVDGEFTVECLAITNENKIINNISTIPCSYSIEIPEKIYRTKNIEDYNLNINVNNVDIGYRQNNNHNIEYDISSNFNIDIRNIENIKLLDNIEKVEGERSDCYSLIIYFVKKGDTLWNIAKKFNTTIDDILAINEIKDKNSIYPGQQIFIPKFVVKV